MIKKAKLFNRNLPSSRETLKCFKDWLTRNTVCLQSMPAHKKGKSRTFGPHRRTAASEQSRCCHLSREHSDPRRALPCDPWSSAGCWDQPRPFAEMLRVHLLQSIIFIWRNNKVPCNNPIVTMPT